MKPQRTVVTLIAPIPWAMILLEIVLIVPRYKQYFDQFGLKVSSFTKIIFGISAWSKSNMTGVFFATMGIIAITVFLTYFSYHEKISSRRRFWSLLVLFGIPVAIFAIIWIDLLQVHSALSEGLKK